MRSPRIYLPICLSICLPVYLSTLVFLSVHRFLSMNLHFLALLALLLLVLVLVGRLLLYRLLDRWRNRLLKSCLSSCSLIETIAGSVEYAMEGGGSDGKKQLVLFFHGSPGGADQAIAIAKSLLSPAQGNVVFVAPNRPGYLNTPLVPGTNESFASQADLAAALLDGLGIRDKVCVCGFSTGCAVALEFAVRHAGRCWALILLSPVLALDPGKTPPLWQSKFLRSDLLWWLLESSVPDQLKALLEPESSSATTAGLLDFVYSLCPPSVRLPGLENDMKQLRSASLREYRLPELARFGLYTLVINGSKDPVASAEQSQYILRKTLQAESFVLKDAGHLLWANQDVAHVQDAVTRFFRKRLPLCPMLES